MHGAHTNTTYIQSRNLRELATCTCTFSSAARTSDIGIEDFDEFAPYRPHHLLRRLRRRYMGARCPARKDMLLGLDPDRKRDTQVHNSEGHMLNSISLASPRRGGLVPARLHREGQKGYGLHIVVVSSRGDPRHGTTCRATRSVLPRSTCACVLEMCLCRW